MAAQKGSLYPKLPALNTASTLVSSDDDDDEEIFDKRGNGEMKLIAVERSRSSGGGLCHSTVSLKEFETAYFRNRRAEPATDSYERNVTKRPNQSTGSSSLNGLGQWCWSVCKEAVIDALYQGGRCLYWGRIVVLGVVLACMVVAITGDRTKVDNPLSCPPPNEFTPCLNDTERQEILSLARFLRDDLHTRAGNFDCHGIQKAQTRNMTVREAQDNILKRFTANDDVMHKVCYLFIFNPHWSISVSNKDGPITDVNLGILQTDRLESSRPNRGVLCIIKIIMKNIWSKLRIMLIGVFLALIIVGVAIWLYKRRRDEKRAIFTLVDRIIDVLEAYNRKMSKEKDLLPYLAIIHVRDMLILPSERHRKMVLWEKAVDWLAKNESRVRVESRMIAGQEFAVWRWLPTEAPPTEEPDSPASVSNAWPTAFEDYPPGVEVAPPVGNPSLCIRLKNMFDKVRNMEVSQIVSIQNSIIERCNSKGHIVHIYVDKRSDYGCLYFKMHDLTSAQAVYKLFHGSWFKSRFITAKYIPESKYYKWFPAAAKARSPLSPSQSVIKFTSA